MSADALPNRPAAAPSLRDGIETVAVLVAQIGSTLALLSRSQEVEGDVAGALAALATLASHTADRIDDLIHIIPDP